MFGLWLFVLNVIWALTAPGALAQEKTVEAAKSSPREIIAAVPRSWPPQYSVDKNGKPVGFAIDVMEEIAARAGVRVKYRVLDAFAEVSEVMRKGEAHIIPNSGITADRAAKYFFTEPVETLVVSIFVRHNTTDIKGLEDLIGRRVAVVEHNISEKLLKPRKDIKSVVHRNAVTALFDLLSGDEDALIFPEPVMLHLARKAGVEDRIKIVGEPLKELKRAIRVQRSEPELFAALNTAVKGFVGTPAYQRIYLKWYGKPMPFWTVAKVAWSMGAGMALILVLMAAWRYQTALRLNRALQKSEKQFKGMFENAGVGVSKTTLDGRFLLVNDRFTEIVGHDRASLFSASFGDITHPEDLKNNLAGIEGLLAGRRQNYVTEKRYLRADGSTVWANLTVVVVRDDDGAPEYLLAVIEEITDAKQAKKALVESEARFRDFADSASDWFWEMDENLRFTYFSPRNEQVTGFGLDAFIGKTRSEISTELTDDPKWMAHFEDLEARRPFREFVYELALPDGDTRHISINGQPVLDEAGNFKGYRGTGRDITERKIAEEARDRLSQAIENVPVGIALFDSNDRLVFYNNRYGEIMKAMSDVLKPGMTFEEVIRTIVERQPAKEAIGREEEFIRERIKRHRNPAGPMRLQREDEWLMVDDLLLPDGSIFTIFSDVTEQMKAEEASQRLIAAIEPLNECVAIYDSDDRLVFWNEAYVKHHEGELEKLIKPGLKLEDLVRARAYSGEAPEAIGREEDYIAERMEQHRKTGAQFETSGKDRWFIYRESPTPEGGTTVVITDITELRRAKETREKLSQAIENVPVGIALFDSDDRLVFYNSRYGELMGVLADILKPGVTFEEMIRTIVDRAPVKDARENEEEFIQERLKHHHNPTGPLDVRRENMWLVANETRLSDGSIFTILTDVTELKKAEEAVKLSEQSFKDFAEAGSDWFWEMDKNFRFTSFPGHKGETSGIPGQENVGKTPWEATGVDPEESVEWRTHLNTLEMHQPFRDFEFSYINNEGEKKFLQVSGKPLFNDSGKFKGYRGTATDFTDKQAIQEQLNQASKLAILGELAAGTAHELNQPLNIIRMETELLFNALEKNYSSDKNIKKQLGTISSQTVRAATIIENMLEFGRKSSPEMEAISVTVAAKKAAYLISKQLEFRNISLSLNLSEPCRKVTGQSIQLEQVVLNLLNNASNAIEEKTKADGVNGGEIMVQVEEFPADDEVKLIIRDTGCGIAEEDIGNIFDPFFTTKDVGKGTGLGLSISYGIVAAMGGTIEAVNIDGGAQFTVRIPTINELPS